jgi:hypothetical protein
VVLAAVATTGCLLAAAQADDPASWNIMDENYGSGPGEISFNSSFNYLFGSSAPTETLSGGKATLTLQQGAGVYYPCKNSIPTMVTDGSDITTEWKMQGPADLSVYLAYSEQNSAATHWGNFLFLNRQFDGSSPTPNAFVDYNRRIPTLNQAPPGFDGAGVHTYRLVRSAGTNSLYIDGALVISSLVSGGGAHGDGQNIEWGFYRDFSTSTADLSLYYFKTATGAFFPTPPPPPQWASNTSGSWNIAGNWSGPVPNAVDATARLWGNISQAQTIFTNAGITLGTLSFDNANTYQITGNGSLSMSVSTGAAKIEVLNGAQKINLPLVFASDTTVTVANGATLTLSDPVTIQANKTVTKTGSLVIEAPLTLETNAVLNVGAGPAARVFGAPSMATGAKVNVQNNGLTVDYRGLGSPATTINAKLTSGHNNGAWNGDGINTSSATATTGLGWKDNPSSESIDIKYTYYGDVNLSGTVDSTDFAAFVAGYGKTTGGIWADGDFNYDGKVTTTDFNQLAGNFGASPISAPALGSAVPEPGCAAALAGLALITSRRRRQ